MSDFNSEFWNWFIIVPTVLGIIACFWLVRWMTPDSGQTDSETGDTGHVWDVDLRELNNPLPLWWLGLFYITLVFGAGYLLLYPGLGTFKGLLGWTSTQAYEQEMEQAEAQYGPLFKTFLKQDIKTLVYDEKAKKMGARLFLNYCASCHGSDARGARGFPNLRDNDWLWGGSAETIEKTILDGRSGQMPAWALPLGGEEGVADMAEYVLSLSGREHDATSAERGKSKFGLFCIGCHGVDGKGNPLLGAPNLTDRTWLHGGSRKRINETIAMGRKGQMPAHREFLGEAKVHLIAAYIYGISGE